MPDVDQFRPDRNWVPADTSVNFTFIDEDGTAYAADWTGRKDVRLKESWKRKNRISAYSVSIRSQFASARSCKPYTSPQSRA